MVGLYIHLSLLSRFVCVGWLTRSQASVRADDISSLLSCQVGASWAKLGQGQALDLICAFLNILNSFSNCCAGALDPLQLSEVEALGQLYRAFFAQAWPSRRCDSVRYINCIRCLVLTDKL